MCEEVKIYKHQIFKVLKWAIECGHITEEQYSILEENINDIDLLIDPKPKNPWKKDTFGWENK